MTSARSWAMAVAAAGANFMSFGLLFSFGLLLTPLADEFDASTPAVASVFSGSVLCYYLAGAVGGSISDRKGARPVVAFGAVALPSGLVLASVAPTLWWLFAAYVPLVGLAVGSCYAPLIGAVGRAMPERQGLAIAVVLTGVGGGTLAMPLVIRALLDRSDWRSSFRVLAAATLVVLAIAAVLVRDRVGARPAGRPAIWRSMARSSEFRRLYLSVVLVAPGFYAPLAFLNDYAVDRAIAPSRAALLVGAIGLGSVTTRIGFGALAPRLGPLRQYQLSHALFLVSLAAWLMAGDRIAILAVSALIHGVAWAAWVTATPLVLAGWFGVDDLGSAVGGFYTGLGLGAVVGPPLTGAIIDRAGHGAAIATVLASSAAALVIVGLAGGGSLSWRRR